MSRYQYTAVFFLAVVFSVPMLIRWDEIVLRSDAKSPQQTYQQQIEAAFSDAICFRDRWVDVNGIVQTLLGKRFYVSADPSSDVVRTSTGNFFRPVIRKNIPPNSEAATDADVAAAASFIKRLNDYLRQKEIPLLYIQAPCKVDPVHGALPGMPGSANEMCDKLIAELRKEQVGIIDLREFLVKRAAAEKRLWESFFYKSDHHWTIETAFECEKFVLPQIAEQLKLPDEGVRFLTDDSSFEHIQEKGLFRGSMGKWCGRGLVWAFIRGDGFTYIVPKFETQFAAKRIVHFHTAHPPVGEWKGAWSETVCEKNAQFYFRYGYDNAYYEFINPHGSGTILVLGDSYSRPFAAFLALAAHKIVMVDPRWYHASLRQIVKKEHFDLCIILHSRHVAPTYSAPKDFLRIFDSGH